MTDPLLVALDVDGTLVTYGGVLSEETRDAARALVAAGHHVVISTGRSVHGTVHVWDELGLTQGWAVCSNGAVTVRIDPAAEKGWTAHEVITFDPSFAIRLLVEEFPTVRFAAEVLGEGYRLNQEFPPGELTGTQHVVSVDELCSEPVTRLAVRAPDMTDEDFDHVVKRLGLHDVTYSVGYTAWLDIAPSGITKASALETLRRELGVNPERTVAVGDGRNDVEMLTWAARGVAMGHAPAEVREAADEVTGTIDDDGVLAVLRSLT
ncbi:MAG: HAD family phosphatase [Actinomycetales bacterium]|nr:HAD family phosphatase [Actinomycetales bacterium]